MSSIEEKNAFIVGTSLTTEDHGCLTGWVTLEYGGSGQSFGGYMLASSSLDDLTPRGYAAEFIKRVMAAAGVSRWEDLKGRPVRVRASLDKVHEIGHLTKDNLWFAPEEVFARLGGNPRGGAQSVREHEKRVASL